MLKGSGCVHWVGTVGSKERAAVSHGHGVGGIGVMGGVGGKERL